MALESAADVQYNRGMVVTVDEIYLPLTLCAPGITDDRFDELCELYEDFRVEYTAEGDVLVMPPTDEETGMRNSSINYQLMRWALTNDRGAVTDSSTGFRLPNGARRSGRCRLDLKAAFRTKAQLSRVRHRTAVSI